MMGSDDLLTCLSPQRGHVLNLEQPHGAVALLAALAHFALWLMLQAALIGWLDVLGLQTQHRRVSCQSPEIGQHQACTWRASHFDHIKNQNSRQGAPASRS